MSTPENKKSEEYSNHSSKNARVIIELHNYSYYHGPSDVEQPDNRFIGRERLLAKFKSVLTDTAKKSGSYLVTGYRGMGKTSFVNEALKGIYSGVKEVQYFFKWVGIIILNVMITNICMDSPIIKDWLKSDKYLYFIAIAIVLTVYSIFFALYSSKKINLYKEKGLIYRYRHVNLLFIISFNIFVFYQANRLQDNLPKAVGLSVLSLLAIRILLSFFKNAISIWKYIFNKIKKIKKWKSIIIDNNKKFKNWKSIKESFKEIRRKCIEIVYNSSYFKFFNFSNLISIRLNLGYSRLKEDDVLQLLARNIRIAYKAHRKGFNISFVIRMVIFVLLYISSYSLYYNPYNLYLKNTIKESLKINALLPSQIDTFHNKPELLHSIFKTLDTQNKLNYENYHSKLIVYRFPHHVKEMQKIDKEEITKPDKTSNYPKDTTKSDIKNINYSQINIIQNEATSNNGSIKFKIVFLVNCIDYFVFHSYNSIIDFVLVGERSKTPILNLIPRSIDYLFILFTFIVFLIFRILSRLIYRGKPTGKQLLKKLDIINDLIDSNLSIERKDGIGLPRTEHIFAKRKIQSYPKADAREIEKHLIEIIDDIGNMPLFSYRADFIIIFDELDKTELQINHDDNENSHAYSPENSRKRQEAVMVLLSNLKFFLSTAQAKFIFIANRDMYDAALADSSDRNFRIGSIFHDVFYLKSFYTDLDPLETDDITSRTEQYVCRFLFPYEKDNCNLKGYNKYLIDKHPALFNENDTKKTKYEKVNARQKREKVIILLQHFIVYLNHVSAGAPSKITSHFENFVFPKDKKGIRNFDNEEGETGILVTKNKIDSLYLFFDFYDQYKLGFFSYLVTPLNYTINKNIKNFGDKLIISTTFLHNHLIKFHRNAFSWRDLEATPELIDINKSPELRDFMGDMVNYMMETHIQEIVNGLYDFKFPKKISQEISYLSKVSEEASALFNFTLDESLTIKQHYRNQLHKLRQLHSSVHEKGDGYLYAIASINLTLADLSFFDEELGEAVSLYLEAIQSIRNEDLSKLSLTQLTLLTRNMLKLGHALEKRKTNDAAFLTYNEILYKIKEYFYNSIKKEKRNYWEKFDNTAISHLLDNIDLYFQPLLARLYLTEKTSFSGAKSSDLYSIETEFDSFLRLLPTDSIMHISAEFWNKVGDLWYYKNRSNPGCDLLCNFQNIKLIEERKPCAACKYYTRNLTSIYNKIKSITVIDYNKSVTIDEISELIIEIYTDKINNISVADLKKFAMALSDIADTFLSCSSKLDKLEHIFKLLFNEDARTANEYFNLKININIIKDSPTKSAVYYYTCSAFLSRKAGDHKSYSLQHIKMLYFLREYILNNNINGIELVIDEIAHKAIKGIYCAYDHIHEYEIKKLKNIFNIDENDPDKGTISLSRISIMTELEEIVTLSEEIKVLILNKWINKSEKEKNELSNRINNIINPYVLNTNMYNRILKMRLKAEFNEIQFVDKLTLNSFDLLEDAGNKTNYLQNQIKIIFDDGKTIISRQQEIESLITDSIFCYMEIIKMHDVFGTTFNLNHSMMADIYDKLYLWSVYFETYKVELNEIDVLSNITENLGILIEPENLNLIDPNYLCEKAIREYYKAKETHSEGQAYETLISNMYYLNDDFNDRFYHFNIALERFKINSGIIDQRIKLLKMKTKEKPKNSDRYSHINYTITEGIN